jgi:N-acetyl sugar amidotransferase
LCVTWAPNLPTEIGRKNLAAFVASGFAHKMGRPDDSVNQKLVQIATAELGDPFQPFIYGQTNFPMQVAVSENIPLIFYGENGEVEYGGDMKNAHKATRDISDHAKHYFSGYEPNFWTQFGFSDQDLAPYFAPPADQLKALKLQIHFFSYYKFWDPQENYYYTSKHTGFRPHDLRSEGTYSKYASLDDQLDGFHYYLGFIKFGIGRATADSAHEIRDGKITRDEGLALVRQYDGEFPRRHLKDFLNYTRMSEAELYALFDRWRADHLWKLENKTWKLR